VSASTSTTEGGSSISSATLGIGAARDVRQRIHSDELSQFTMPQLVHLIEFFIEIRAKGSSSGIFGKPLVFY
jgi:hypothetical protein